MTTFPRTTGIRTKTFWSSKGPEQLDEQVNQWLSRFNGTVLQVSFSTSKSRTHCDGGYTTLCVNIMYTAPTA